VGSEDIDGVDVQTAARAATARPDARVERWAAEPAAHRPENMTTARLDVVRATLDDGSTCTMFVKTLRPASAAPEWAFIPDVARPQVLAELRWLDELEAYRSRMHADLPHGLRTPRVLHVVERPERIQLWLEAVRGGSRWDLDAYRMAARALGGLTARWPERRVAQELGFRRRTLHVLWYGKTSQVDLVRLADEATWAHPALASDPALRDELAAVARCMPGWIAELDERPHALAHGDASPANLLLDGDRVVAVDWSYVGTSPAGSDLGQLLAGRAVTGELPASELATTADALVTAYASGLDAGAAGVDEVAVRGAFLAHLLVRAVFDAVATAPDVEPARAAARLALARFSVDAARALPAPALAPA